MYKKVLFKVLALKDPFFLYIRFGAPIDVGCPPDVSVSNLRLLGTLWCASGRVAVTYRLRRPDFGGRSAGPDATTIANHNNREKS